MINQNRWINLVKSILINQSWWSKIDKSTSINQHRWTKMDKANSMNQSRWTKIDETKSIKQQRCKKQNWWSKNDEQNSLKQFQDLKTRYSIPKKRFNKKHMFFQWNKHLDVFVFELYNTWKHDVQCARKWILRHVNTETYTRFEKERDLVATLLMLSECGCWRATLYLLFLYILVIILI